MLGQKTNFDKFKRIETISRNFFSDNNGMELVINYKKENGKTTNTWRLNNALLKNHWENEEIRKYLQTNENGKTFQTLWDAAKEFLRGIILIIQAFLKNQEKHQKKKKN